MRCQGLIGTCRIKESIECILISPYEGIRWYQVTIVKIVLYARCQNGSNHKQKNKHANYSDLGGRSEHKIDGMLDYPMAK